MNSFWKNFIQRAATGILFIGIIGGALVLSEMTYAIVMTCVITLATNEYCRLVKATGMSPHFVMALMINLVAFAIGFLINQAGFDPRTLLVIVGLIWATFLVELFCSNPKPLANIAMTLLACIYVGLPFALFNLLAYKTPGVYDYRPVIGLFVLVWINDTGAYLCGVTLGRHKLCERISPKKTIEGFIGGILLTLVGAWLLVPILYGGDLWISLAYGLVVSILGTCGDLIESMFKRSAGIKDSGKILPGHGGILDRFDAIIFVAPIVSLLYYFFT